MAAWFSAVAGIIRETFFPAKCVRCEAICPSPKSASRTIRMAGFLCPKCDAQLEWIQSPLCLKCGRPFASDQGVDHVCGICDNKSFAFESARAAGLYADALKALIHQYKYRCCEPLATPLGRLLWDAFWRHWDLGDIDAIVPVPLHWRRLRKRGFNQAALLLRKWPCLAANIGIDLDRLPILTDLLERRRYTLPQTGLDHKARQVNVRNAFSIRKGTAKGLRLLLVDDVFTTGATAHSCAQVLKRDGAVSVKLMTLARASQ